MFDDTDENPNDAPQGIEADSAGYCIEMFRNVAAACHRWLMEHDAEYASEHGINSARCRRGKRKAAKP